MVVGDISGLSMCPEAVAKSTQVEGQIFISLFLACLVRPCRSQRQHIQGSESQEPAQKVPQCSKTLLGALGMAGRAHLVLQARTASGPATSSWAGTGKGAVQLGEVPVLCV